MCYYLINKYKKPINEGEIMYYKAEFEKIAGILNPKGSKSAIVTIMDLIDKLNEKEIKDDELQDMFSRLLNALVAYHDGEKAQKKNITRMYSAIVNYANTKYNLVQKGTLVGTYMSIFMGAGVAMGVALSGANSAFMGIGIAIGTAIGLAVGAGLEKKAENEGRVY